MKRLNIGQLVLVKMYVEGFDHHTVTVAESHTAGCPTITVLKHHVMKRPTRKTKGGKRTC